MPKFVADFHIHSKYSRAVSQTMVLEELDAWADDKGILVMGTGDFTHPGWFRDIKAKLEPAEPGLFKLRRELKRKTMKDTHAETRFVLTVELSGIYQRHGRTRRIHNLVFMPDLAGAEKLNTQLGWIGNLASDGRPILGLDSEELAKIVFGITPEAAIIPAHAWTPWFSVFGSMSGFDSLEECFGVYAKHIFAIETGLSSDPPMNWRLSKLDRIALISNSDSHSPSRIGREANQFNTELSYRGIMDAIRSRDPARFTSTYEFFPEEGKYHYDGHRDCKVSWAPEETKANKGICSVCGKPVTVGVMHRVDVLADRPAGFRPEGRVPYRNIVPLDEVIGEALGVGPSAKGVRKDYEALIRAFGSELTVVLETPIADIGRVARADVAEGVRRMREGRVKVIPGYDGEYGKVKMFAEGERIKGVAQKALF